MEIKIQWDNGWMTLDYDRFFPTTVAKARQVFKLMQQDNQHDFDLVRKYLVCKVRQMIKLKEDYEKRLKHHIEQWFDGKYWYGDIVKNEKIAKELSYGIAKLQHDITNLNGNIELFDRIVGCNK